MDYFTRSYTERGCTRNIAFEHTLFASLLYFSFPLPAFYRITTFCLICPSRVTMYTPFANGIEVSPRAICVR